MTQLAKSVASLTDIQMHMPHWKHTNQWSAPTDLVYALVCEMLYPRHEMKLELRRLLMRMSMCEANSWQTSYNNSKDPQNIVAHLFFKKDFVAGFIFKKYGHLENKAEVFLAPLMSK